MEQNKQTKKLDIRWLRALLPILLVAFVVPMVFAFGGCSGGVSVSTIANKTYTLSSVEWTSNPGAIPYTNSTAYKANDFVEAANRTIVFGADTATYTPFTIVSVGVPSGTPVIYTTTTIASIVSDGTLDSAKFAASRPILTPGTRLAGTTAKTIRVSNGSVQWQDGEVWRTICTITNNGNSIQMTVKSGQAYKGTTPTLRLTFTA